VIQKPIEGRENGVISSPRKVWSDRKPAVLHYGVSNWTELFGLVLS